MSDPFSLKYSTNKLCVIISQEEGRSGGEYDRKRLKNLFTNLNFEVVTITDPKVNRFNRKQRNIRKRCEKGDIGLLVVFVLCHGVDDKVEICRGVKTEIDKLIANFTVEKMKTKPKLFFFQCCRGENYETAVEHVDVEGVNENVDEKGCQEVSHKLDLSKLPIDSDTLVSFASIPGCKCIRNRDCGTYFIYLIYQVFVAHAAKTDVITMLTLVNRLLATKVMWHGTKSIIMQMASFKSKLTRKVFLTNDKFNLQCGPFFKINDSTHGGGDFTDGGWDCADDDDDSRDSGDDSTDNDQADDKKRLYNLAKLLQLTERDLIPNHDSVDYSARNGSGLCLVFVKGKNTLTQAERIGSNKDVQNLLKLFTITLGYAEENVFIYSDKSKEEILETLKEVTADKSLMLRITNFIVIMLTHGDDDKIWAQDQTFVVDNLVLPVKNCVEILKIPKIFLIQADGLNLNKILEDRNNCEDNSIDQFKIHDGKHLPSEANMLFMYSNVPASSEEGTPLVKHFCNSVKAGYSNNDLLSILTVVNRKIAEEIMDASSVSIDNGEKMPFFESRLIENVMLGRNRFNI